ncbi:MarR family transcriptional regulator [Rathayibacter sp. YIM 133350]|uniref:MarR family winged helix-turn-helix transcriptional regulator n=1 Tax=Rathayibacter sp. YIM 133350 TaxID=3131992 RepID=UPI00307EF39B
MNADDQSIERWPTGRLLSTAARRVEQAWAEALERQGLTHAGLIVLDQLSAGPASQAALARAARVEAQTMSRTVDRLVREGLVVREADPGDRRRHVITRTAAGTQARERAGRVESELFPDIGRESDFRSALLAIIEQAAPRR